jgi:hypothetical protein
LTVCMILVRPGASRLLVTRHAIRGRSGMICEGAGEGEYESWARVLSR